MKLRKQNNNLKFRPITFSSNLEFKDKAYQWFLSFYKNKQWFSQN